MYKTNIFRVLNDIEILRRHRTLKFASNFDVSPFFHTLMPNPKYEEDQTMSSKVIADSIFEKTKNVKLGLKILMLFS